MQCLKESRFDFFYRIEWNMALENDLPCVKNFKGNTMELTVNIIQ